MRYDYRYHSATVRWEVSLGFFTSLLANARATATLRALVTEGLAFPLPLRLLMNATIPANLEVGLCYSWR